MEELKDDIKRVHEEIERESLFVQAITGEVGKVIVGQKYLVDRLMVGLLANGHILIEGVPGLARLWRARLLQHSTGFSSRPICFRPTSSGPRSTTSALVSLPPARDRSSPTLSWPTKSTAPRPRCRALCWRRCRNGR